ncbi:Protein shisa-5 [Tupaia chinensis]|uniref:Protein shisa-5 n=1 Tax=Tupaia chinensis TaxID=246437 RepID=L8Y0D4_TUPCH|nr:Protein shisa-5 [Tupaia chinensis]
MAQRWLTCARWLLWRRCRGLALQATGEQVCPALARGEVCVAFRGHDLSPVSCPDFCCGTCDDQYCCSDMLKRFVWSEQSCAGPADSSCPLGMCAAGLEQLGSALRFRSNLDSDPMPGEWKGAGAALVPALETGPRVSSGGCRRAMLRICIWACAPLATPVVTTTATTVVHAPYPQPVSVPPSYPGPTYQGYHPMPHPGMPAAPYPTQYPPPYPAQPVGPPAYHETVAGGAAAPYPASQPPYNPAYMDPPKAAP